MAKKKLTPNLTLHAPTSTTAGDEALKTGKKAQGVAGKGKNGIETPMRTARTTRMIQGWREQHDISEIRKASAAGSQGQLRGVTTNSRLEHDKHLQRGRAVDPTAPFSLYGHEQRCRRDCHRTTSHPLQASSATATKVTHTFNEAALSRHESLQCSTGNHVRHSSRQSLLVRNMA
ncbi:hypothetical protein BC835DRAFT_1307345 [Cytidiella melzeri]|nr:hypothetical protein BC835DRAFT_1307345 [Cytidiella melzeri]